MTDEEFQSAIILLQKGDKLGLKQIYDAYIKLIYSVIYTTVGKKEDAEDITSEFFIKLIRVLPQYNTGNGHKTWLVTIAKNMALDFIRKNNREVLAFSNDDEDSDSVMERMNSDANDNPVENRATLAEDMRKAMSSLNPREKEIIDLKLIGEYKFKEIAQMTNQPIGTVTWIYNQGILKLRRYLKDYA